MRYFGKRLGLSIGRDHYNERDCFLAIGLGSTDRGVAPWRYRVSFSFSWDWPRLTRRWHFRASMFRL